MQPLNDEERPGYPSEQSYLEEAWLDADISPEVLNEETTPPTIEAEADFANPLDSKMVGDYLPPNRRKLISGSEEIIREMAARGLFPSFLEAGPRELLRLDPCRTRAAIVAVGGTAPGTNAVIHAIVRRHQRYVDASLERWERRGRVDSRPDLCGSILGIVNGFEGLMAPQPWPAAAVPGPLELTVEKTASWRDDAGCHLGLSRYDFSAGDLVSKAAENIISAQLDILYVIGGDGGMEGALRLWNSLHRNPRGRDIAVVGIPKTMDNDIGWTWQSLGHRTALAEAARLLDVAYADARTNRRVMLVELFGADAGFVTASAALASGKADCVLIREEPPNPWKTIAYIAARVRRKNHALVVIAEGALSLLGQRLLSEGLVSLPKPSSAMLKDPWYQRRDLHDSALKWMRDALRAEFLRPEVFTGHIVINQPGYLIRAVPPLAEDVIYAQRLGDLAVDNALAGYNGFMLTQWNTHYVLVPLPLAVKIKRRVLTSGIFWREVVASTGQPPLTDDAPH